MSSAERPPKQPKERARAGAVGVGYDAIGAALSGKEKRVAPERFTYKDAQELVKNEIDRRGLVRHIVEAKQDAELAADAAGRLSLFKKNPFIPELRRLRKLERAVMKLVAGEVPKKMLEGYEERKLRARIEDKKRDAGRIIKGATVGNRPEHSLYRKTDIRREAVLEIINHVDRAIRFYDPTRPTYTIRPAAADLSWLDEIEEDEPSAITEEQGEGLDTESVSLIEQSGTGGIASEGLPSFSEAKDSLDDAAERFVRSSDEEGVEALEAAFGTYLEVAEVREQRLQSRVASVENRSRGYGAAEEEAFRAAVIAEEAAFRRAVIAEAKEGYRGPAKRAAFWKAVFILLAASLAVGAPEAARRAARLVNETPVAAAPLRKSMTELPGTSLADAVFRSQSVVRNGASARDLDSRTSDESGSAPLSPEAMVDRNEAFPRRGMEPLDAPGRTGMGGPGSEDEQVIP